MYVSNYKKQKKDSFKHVLGVANSTKALPATARVSDSPASTSSTLESHVDYDHAIHGNGGIKLGKKIVLRRHGHSAEIIRNKKLGTKRQHYDLPMYDGGSEREDGANNFSESDDKGPPATPNPKKEVTESGRDRSPSMSQTPVNASRIKARALLYASLEVSPQLMCRKAPPPAAGIPSKICLRSKTLRPLTEFDTFSHGEYKGSCRQCLIRGNLPRPPQYTPKKPVMEYSGDDSTMC